MKLSRQLGILIAFATIGFIILAAIALYSLRANLIDSRKHEIEAILTLAKLQAAHYVELVNENKMTREEGEARLVEALTTMRYDASYIWANDDKSIARVHPRDSVLGEFQKNHASRMQELKDSGSDILFTVVMSKKPGTDHKVVKVNGQTAIPGWNWGIGFGVYMDDLQSTFIASAVQFAAAVVVILIIIIAAAVYLARNILRNIGGEPSYAVAVTNSIADGYLNETIQGNFKQNSLLGSIARMQQSLQEMVKKIQHGSALLASSTKELNDQMQSITEASQKSSDASYSTASAIQELSSCIDEIATSARNTETNSEASSALSIEGEEIVKASAHSIYEISTQISSSTEGIASLQKLSLQIGSIVDVIRDIAEQTNLLALNAAIEAARAGEQGRGFAVVADEVRTLASRTATATSEITETINVVQSETENVAQKMQAILPKVETSVSSSDAVSEMLTKIRAGADETLNRIRDVTNSAEEQNIATNTLAEHVEQISNMVNETAEAVANSRKNMADLDALAVELNESVSYFKV